MLTFSPLTEQNLAGVCAVEKASFSDPWSDALLAAELSNERAHYVVASEKDEIIGYAALQSVCDEGEVLNIAVLPEKRGRGVGGALLLKLIEEGKRQNLSLLHLEVRESNQGAIGLYLRAGFKETGFRKNYYQNPGEGAVLMTLSLVKGEQI